MLASTRQALVLGKVYIVMLTTVHQITLHAFAYPTGFGFLQAHG